MPGRGDLIGMQRQHLQPRVQQPFDQQAVRPLDRDQQHAQPHECPAQEAHSLQIRPQRSQLAAASADAKRLSVDRLGNGEEPLGGYHEEALSRIYGDGETLNDSRRSAGAAGANPLVRWDLGGKRGGTTYWTVADLLDDGEVKRSQFSTRQGNVYRLDEHGAV